MNDCDKFWCWIYWIFISGLIFIGFTFSFSVPHGCQKVASIPLDFNGLSTFFKSILVIE
jgi:hypothetical protein